MKRKDHPAARPPKGSAGRIGSIPAGEPGEKPGAGKRNEKIVIPRVGSTR
jgi:hypothetical protein